MKETPAGLEQAFETTRIFSVDKIMEEFLTEVTTDGQIEPEQADELRAQVMAHQQHYATLWAQAVQDGAEQVYLEAIEALRRETQQDRAAFWSVIERVAAGKMPPDQAAKVLLLSGLEETSDVIPVLRFGRARLELLTTAVALRLFALEHDGPPASLEALVPDYLPQIPRDPFAGAAVLHYAVEGAGWRIYSLGPDGEDQQGQVRFDDRVPLPNSQEPQAGDLIVEHRFSKLGAQLSEAAIKSRAEDGRVRETYPDGTLLRAVIASIEPPAHPVADPSTP